MQRKCQGSAEEYVNNIINLWLVFPGVGGTGGEYFSLIAIRPRIHEGKDFPPKNTWPRPESRTNNDPRFGQKPIPKAGGEDSPGRKQEMRDTMKSKRPQQRPGSENHVYDQRPGSCRDGS
jgi:hypothetical protein